MEKFDDSAFQAKCNDSCFKTFINRLMEFIISLMFENKLTVFYINLNNELLQFFIGVHRILSMYLYHFEEESLIEILASYNNVHLMPLAHRKVPQRNQYVSLFSRIFFHVNYTDNCMNKFGKYLSLVLINLFWFSLIGSIINNSGKYLRY